jgi:hypothetical protein
MAFIPVPGACSIELIHEVQGQRCENIFYAHRVDGWSESELAQVGVIVADWYGVYGKQLTHTENSLSMIVLKDLSSADGATSVYQAGLPIAGVATGDPTLPLNVTAAVSFGTAKRGRSFRGRIYQIGMVISQVAGSQLTSTYRAALIAAYGALVTAINGGDAVMSVVSRYANKAPRASGITTPITSVSVDINTDSQRRRLIGRGQ